MEFKWEYNQNFEIYGERYHDETWVKFIEINLLIDNPSFV